MFFLFSRDFSNLYCILCAIYLLIKQFFLSQMFDNSHSILKCREKSNNNLQQLYHLEIQILKQHNPRHRFTIHNKRILTFSISISVTISEFGPNREKSWGTRQRFYHFGGKHRYLLQVHFEHFII